VPVAAPGPAPKGGAGGEPWRMFKLRTTNELYDTVIRLQRVCGQPCRNPAGPFHRWRCMVDTARKSGLAENPNSSGCSRAFRATCTPPTVFPSLRAHEPNPAGRAIHPDLAGEMLENNLLLWPDSSGGHKR
jgi:hypothetical protein